MKFLNRKFTLPCLVAITALICGCTTPQPYDAAEQAYAAGNYQQAKDIFNQYSTTNNPLRYQALYYEGMSDYNLGLCPEAIKAFDTVIEFSKNRPLRARALEGRGKTFLKMDKPKESEHSYQDLLNKYDDIYPVDQALAGIITAKKQEGDIAGALNYEERLRREFPNNILLKSKTPIGDIWRVRLKRHFLTKQAAETEMAKLKKQGLEIALFREFAQGGDRFIIQIGAFSSLASAQARADSARALGWDIEVLRK